MIDVGLFINQGRPRPGDAEVGRRLLPTHPRTISTARRHAGGSCRSLRRPSYIRRAPLLKPYLHNTDKIKQCTVHTYIFNNLHHSSANFQRPPGRMASRYRSITFSLSSCLAASRSCSNSCVSGMSARQKPGGERARSCVYLCFPY